MKVRNGSCGLSIALFFASSLCALGQTAADQQQNFRDVAVRVESVRVMTPAGAALQTQTSTMAFATTEIGFDAKVVAGAPFSAEAVTEFSQVLATGQRILRKSVSPMYRDSLGRTRREQAIDIMIGPFGLNPKKRTIIINDPEAHLNYVLDPDSRTATKRAISNISPDLKAEAAGMSIRVIKSGVVPDQPGWNLTLGDKVVGNVSGFIGGSPGDVRKETLGTQVIDGVQAEGTRIVETIPTGAIGNDSPIEITTETWVSPELGIVIKTVHNDPRSGENVYQLTNIKRGEPAAALFQVPSDYTVTDAPVSGNVIYTIKK